MGYNTLSWLIVIGFGMQVSMPIIQCFTVRSNYYFLPCASDTWRRICVVLPCMDSFDVLYNAAGEGGGAVPSSSLCTNASEHCFSRHLLWKP